MLFVMPRATRSATASEWYRRDLRQVTRSRTAAPGKST